MINKNQNKHSVTGLEILIVTFIYEIARIGRLFYVSHERQHKLRYKEQKLFKCIQDYSYQFWYVISIAAVRRFTFLFQFDGEFQLSFTSPDLVTLIFLVHIFISAVIKSFWPKYIKSCVTCGVLKTNENKNRFARCQGCNSLNAVYCSRQCQKKHWTKEHKYTCKRDRQTKDLKSGQKELGKSFFHYVKNMFIVVANANVITKLCVLAYICILASYWPLIFLGIVFGYLVFEFHAIVD